MGNAVSEDVAAEIAKLEENCTSVSLTGKDLRHCPSQLFHLSHLSNLNLSRNDIESLPEELFLNKTALSTLFLNTNRLTNVPRSLIVAANLTCLSIQHNRLIRVPEPILELSSLHELELQDNLLTSIGSISHLTRLQHLNLNRNRLTRIRLSGVVLVSLNVCSNRLVEVSRCVRFLNDKRIRFCFRFRQIFLRRSDIFVLRAIVFLVF
jgi:internalin A